eukprot:UN25329
MPAYNLLRLVQGELQSIGFWNEENGLSIGQEFSLIPEDLEIVDSEDDVAFVIKILHIYILTFLWMGLFLLNFAFHMYGIYSENVRVKNKETANLEMEVKRKEKNRQVMILPRLYCLIPRRTL